MKPLTPSCGCALLRPQPAAQADSASQRIASALDRLGMDDCWWLASDAHLTALAEAAASDSPSMVDAVNTIAASGHG